MRSRYEQSIGHSDRRGRTQAKRSNGSLPAIPLGYHTRRCRNPQVSPPAGTRPMKIHKLPLPPMRAADESMHFIDGNVCGIGAEGFGSTLEHSTTSQRGDTMTIRTRQRRSADGQFHRTCHQCSTPFVGTGSRPKFCSDQCREQSRLKSVSPVVHAEKTCVHCQQGFKPNRAFAVFCSKECRLARYWQDRHRMRELTTRR